MGRLNLFIVDDDESIILLVKNYLRNKFGPSLSISTFSDGESCLDNINENIHLVILDYGLNEKNGNDILGSIKLASPKTEVIILTGNEDIYTAIDSFRKGAKDYVIKDRSSLKRLGELIHKSITRPVQRFIKELGIPRFRA